MLAIFRALAQTCIDSGFSQALIWKQGLTHRDESTVFWFNLGAALAMALCLSLLAPWVAVFFREEQLILILRVFAVLLVVDSLGNIQAALLRKELAFQRSALALTTSVLISGVIGIWMALRGFGVWSLVGMNAAASISRVIMLCWVRRWHPLPVFDVASFLELFRYGANLLGSSLLHTVAQNIYAVLIGRLYLPAQLGLYDRSERIVNFGSSLLTQAVSQVHFPVLVRLQDDHDRLRRAYLRVFKLMVMLIFPLMMGLGVTAPNLIPVLLGDQWVGAVPYLQILCVGGAVAPMNGLNCNLLKVIGRTDLYLRLELIKKVMLFFFLSFTWVWGVEGLLWGGVCSAVLCLFVNGWYSRKLLNLPIGLQLLHVRTVFVCVVIMGAGVQCIGYSPLGRFAELAVQGGAGILLYVALLWLVRDGDLIELLTAIKKVLKRKFYES